MLDLKPGERNPFQDILDQISYLKQQQANGAPYDREAARRLEDLTEIPRWGPFYGFNNVEIPNFEIKWGGSVSFAQHLSKPLSGRLWKDVTMRLQAKWIQIYRPNDTIPCVATSEGQCNIHLDAQGNVKDISFTPYSRRR